MTITVVFLNGDTDNYEFTNVPRKGDTIRIDDKAWLVQSAHYELVDNIYKPKIHVY